MSRSLQSRIWLVVLVTSIGWGTTGVVTRVAFEEGLRPLTIVAVSSAIAAIAVMVLLSFNRSIGIGRIGWRVGLVMSVMSVTLPFLFRNLALQFASAGFVGLASALVPLATAIAAHFMLTDEPLRAGTLGGLTIALAGVGVLVLSGDAGIGEGGRPVLAGVYALVGVVSVAVGSVYAKRHAGAYSPLGVSGVQFTVGAMLATVAALIGDGIPGNPSLRGWLALLYIGLVGTFVPVVLYYWLIRYVTVTYSAIIGYIIPLVAVAVGVVALDEKLQPGILIGGALILAGVIITDRIRLRSARRTAPITPIP